MKKINIILYILIFTFNFFANALNDLPKSPKINDHYVFYSHGYIVEGDNPKPIHKRFGIYDFPSIKHALTDPEYYLVAYHRPFKTDPFTYANILSKQVEFLLNKGVPAKNITLIGFSRGGFITAISSSILANKELNFIIMAACTNHLINNKDIVIYGNLLSIYETSDRVGSCDNLVSKKPKTIKSYTEIAISTGKAHGAFYTPDPSWVIPIKKWIKEYQNNE